MRGHHRVCSRRCYGAHSRVDTKSEPHCFFPPHVMSDGKGTVQGCYGTKDIACKRRQQDIASLREALQIGDVAGVHHLQGTKNPVDPLTKSLPFNAPTMQILEEMLTGKAPEKN